MRLDKARELLIDGQLAVTRVAQEAGYGSVSHFISEFRLQRDDPACAPANRFA